jgi:hypothetical protein
LQLRKREAATRFWAKQFEGALISSAICFLFVQQELTFLIYCFWLKCWWLNLNQSDMKTFLIQQAYNALP